MKKMWVMTRVQEFIEVVGALERQACFLHAGFQILLGALLGVKTHATPQRALAPQGPIQGGQIIFFGLGHPFTRARLHT
jgi:hypothetical protein